MRERIQKLISTAGIASRREAERMIAAGTVRINGVTAELGQSADPELDEITVNGHAVKIGAPARYILLNKPRGYLTTMHDDKGRPTVADLVRGVGTRVYPVGRLDLNSDGLLLMTNDGAFANSLMHPKQEVRKTYVASVSGDVSAALPILRTPMEIDGYLIRPAEVEDLGNCTLRFTIHEGRNRQIRKMCAAAGLRVLRLTRIAEGTLRLGTLKPGAWRDLTQEELNSLKEIAGYEREKI